MTVTRLLRVASGVVLAALYFTCAALGQTETATISGLITDDSGAVVPGVQVKLQNIERGTATSATTNNAGIYVFASVHPGQYQLTVQKPGFKQVDFLGLIVNIQDHIEQNFRLQVGSVAESVTVEASALQLNTTDATVSTVVDRQFAENLPLNGRSFQTLIQLTPGVVLTAYNGSDNGQFSVNGQRAASNYWMVDGVSANVGIGTSQLTSGNGLSGANAAFSVLGGTNSLVSVDAMQEFRIQTSTFAPEFGRTPGGQISIVTRSGSKQFHGTAFDYLRNHVFDANDWFANSAGLPKPRERQNDFGGTFSGPIVKNRTFFFFSYEGLRLRLPQTTLSTVPDLLARQNAVPAMQRYLKAFPLQNGADNVATGVAQFNASYSNPATLDAYGIRIDHKLNDKLTVFGRYNYSPSEFFDRGGSAGLAAMSVVQRSHITTQTATAGATWLLSSVITNDVRFNYSRVNAFSNFSLDNFDGAVPLTSPSLPNGYTNQNARFLLQINGLLRRQLVVGKNAQNIQRQINIVDSLSVQKGSHSLKFGVDFRRLSPLSAPQLYNQVTLFRNVSSAQNGNSFLGRNNSFRNVTILFHNLGVFAQDTWHVAPRLTLTYGVRWDVDFAPSSLNGPAMPAVTGYNLNDFSRLSIAPTGTPVFKTTYGNIAPRLGMAYQLTQNQKWGTVLRGGFGIFYDLMSSETGNLFDFPPFAGSASISGTFPYTPTQLVVPPIPSANVSQLYAFNPNLKMPYTLEWNVALEQALGTQQSLSASYIGAAGRRLFQASVIDFPPTNPDVIGTFVDNTSTSDYRALQLEFQRRLSRGLQVLASYSWSHSVDTGSAGSSTVGSNIGVPGGSSNASRGPSDFDIRRAFSAGITYNFPAPRFNAFMNAILRGWSLQNIIQARSAPPVNVSDQNFFFFNGGILADIRPDLVSGQPVYLFGPQYPGGKAFNPAAFTDPPVDPNTGNPLRQGNVPRNFLRGFGATQWDLAIHRDFPVRESVKIQFRAEMFNVLNHPNFGQPGNAWPFDFGVSTQMLGRSLAGQSLGSGGFDSLYQIGGPRSIQFALKLIF